MNLIYLSTQAVATQALTEIAVGFGPFLCLQKFSLQFTNKERGSSAIKNLSASKYLTVGNAQRFLNRSACKTQQS